MKKVLNLLLFVALTLSLAACGGNDRVLKAQIESGQKHCPMNLGIAGKLTSMTYDESSREVTFELSLNKQVMDVNDIKQYPEIARETIRLALSQGDMKKLVYMMADADASLKVIYKNKGSKDEYDITFSADEIKEIKNNPMTEEDTNRLLLQTQLKGEKARLPYKVADGLKMVDINDQGNTVVYTCEVNEDLYDVDDMGNAKEELKEDMRKMLRDRTMRKQAEILSSLGKGFEYKYVGTTSGKTVNVVFTAEELGEIAKKAK